MSGSERSDDDLSLGSYGSDGYGYEYESDDSDDDYNLALTSVDDEAPMSRQVSFQERPSGICREPPLCKYIAPETAFHVCLSIHSTA